MSTQLGSLRRFLATASPRRPGPDGAAVVVGSGKGGTGTSTVAALLALVGAAEGRRTLLIDADRDIATLHLLLGVDAGPGLGALREGLDASDILVPAAPNLELLSCATDPEEAPDTLGRAEWSPLLRRVVGLYGEYDLVVVDAGSRLEGLRAIETLAPGRLLAVAAADRVALAATHALVKSCTSRVPGLPTTVVFNRSTEPEARAAYNVLQGGVGRFLARSVEYAGTLPDDPRYRQGIEQGQTIQEAATRAALADAVQALAPRITPAVAAVEAPGALIR